MSKALNGIFKRRRWPIKLDAETTIFIRSMTNREIEEYAAIEDRNLSVGYMLGTVLVDDAGAELHPRLPEESAKDFAARVTEATQDMPNDTKMDVARTLAKVHTVPDTLAKN